MKRTPCIAAVALVETGIAAGQDVSPNGNDRSDSEFLTTGICESKLTVSISAYKEMRALLCAEYLIDTDTADQHWCRREEFALSVTPHGASLTFMPEVEESCPDPKLVTGVCRVDDESQVSRDVCVHRPSGATATQNSHTAARELWGMDCPVAVGELAASGVWGLASRSRAAVTPGN